MFRNTAILLSGFISILGLGNGASLPKEEQQFRITGLDGGILTAHPEPAEGNPYPAPGNVTTERFDPTNLAQRWYIIGDEGRKLITSETNDWNEIRVYLICPSCFPTDNRWAIEAAEGGTSLISTTFILDDEVSCILNNGLDKRISFGPCDHTPGSSSHWRIVPILTN